MARVRPGPPGWHLRAGSVQALGGPTYRIQRTSQDDYWRTMASELNAGASVVVSSTPATFNSDSNGISFGSALSSPGFPQTLTVVPLGPQGTGERWDVTMVQVQTSSQIGLPPLVIQQVAAQAAGKTITPPPPIAVRVWRGAAGVPLHLLASTSQGGYDTLGISCPLLAAGEQLLVAFYSAAIGDTAQVIAKGTKYVLGV